MASMFRTHQEWCGHSARLELERNAIATNAALEIAELRETLREIIAHDGPGFPAGTCARIAEDALGPENSKDSLPELGESR